MPSTLAFILTKERADEEAYKPLRVGVYAIAERNERVSGCAISRGRLSSA